MPTPEIIAHRGAPRERPENTLAAFDRACILGADAVELDVHRTRDGVLVVHHDAVPSGPASGGRSISEQTVEEVEASRTGDAAIPTLASVIGLVGARCRIYCELKGQSTAQEAVRLLGPLGTGAAVHAFDHRQVASARALAPGVPRGVLETSYHLDCTGSLRSVAGRDLWQQWELIDADLVQAVHAMGARVVAWTVNDAPALSLLAALGVDAICTDDVPLVRTVLGRR